MTCQFVLGFGCGNTLVWLVIILTVIYGMYGTFKVTQANNIFQTCQNEDKKEETISQEEKSEVLENVEVQ